MMLRWVKGGLSFGGNYLRTDSFAQNIIFNYHFYFQDTKLQKQSIRGEGSVLLIFFFLNLTQTAKGT